MRQAAFVLAGLLILKVTAEIVWGYRQYFPPSFLSEFLRGRESYFFGGYRWAFYLHIASGPITLLLGLALVSDRFRRTFPRWHRVLGRIQVAVVLFLVAPSGLWMARYAEAGPVAGVGFGILAVLTGFCAIMGFLAAYKRRFATHRRWMWRCFLLLCSAVVLRIAGGIATVGGLLAPWFNPLLAWMSWVLPLVIFEWSCLERRTQASATCHSLPESDEIRTTR